MRSLNFVSLSAAGPKLPSICIKFRLQIDGITIHYNLPYRRESAKRDVERSRSFDARFHDLSFYHMVASVCLLFFFHPDDNFDRRFEVER